jgi:enoyl-CoA hydratase/carnithine racemase
MAEYETIDFSIRNHIASIMLNRPDRLNSFTRQMCEEFASVWELIKNDDDVRVVVLHAAGERAFCSGVDVKSGDFISADNPWTEETDPGRFLRPKVNQVWKPLIAAVHGICAGGAFYWLGEADVVLASPDAQFFDPHVSYGMTAALEPLLMRYQLPLPAVLRMTILGLNERMSAETALHHGFVSEVVPREGLLERAFELAARVASQSPVAVQGSVKAIWQSLDVGRSASLSSALMYTQIGNPIGIAEIERTAVSHSEWTLR